MLARVLCIPVILLGFATTPAALAKDESSKKERKRTEKPSPADDWRRHTEAGWKSRSHATDMPRRTEGHRPQDLNGDRVISRHEWPGSDESFRKLDRNGDGVLTDADRSIRSRRR